jgi:BolA protein
MNTESRAGDRITRIRDALTGGLETDVVEIQDQSALHAGHAGARSGLGHFYVRIVSPKFQGLRPVDRHRLVYQAMGELMRTDVHALGIDALTPEESAA